MVEGVGPRIILGFGPNPKVHKSPKKKINLTVMTSL